MHNLTLKDVQIFLAITTSGVTLDQITHLIPNYKDAFDSTYRNALACLFRLEHAGLVNVTKIHIDDWDASHFDVKVNDSSVDDVLNDNWYQYSFHVSPKGRECRKNMRDQFRDTLFGAPKEAIVYRPAIEKNSVRVVKRLETKPPVEKSELILPDFNPNPDSIAHQIIDCIKSWTNRLGKQGMDFENTDFSKAYDSYEHLFDELIGNGYKSQDIARAVYLMEDVVDVENDIDIWHLSGIDLLGTLRRYTPAVRTISGEWADGVNFITIPEPTHEGLSELLHYMSLRFQEIDNGDYKQRRKWHGTEQTPESKLTEDELLVEELETLVINGYTVMAHIANYVKGKDPRQGHTALKTLEDFTNQQGFKKKEFLLIITATKALDLLESSFTLTEFEQAATTSSAHTHYILGEFVRYGLIKVVSAEGQDAQIPRYIKII